MSEAGPEDDQAFQHNVMTSFIRIGGVVLLLYVCLQIVEPFFLLVLWGALIAVSLYPLHLALAARLGGSEKRSSTLLVVFGLTLLLVPVWIASDSTVTFAEELAADMKAGTLHVPAPKDAVADWPLIGPRVHAEWTAAASDLRATAKQYRPQLARGGEWVLERALGMALGVLQFVGSIVIAGVLLVNGPGSYRFSVRTAERLAGTHGRELVDLCINTIRSVTKGVLGVALLQAALALIGFVAIGLPAAGVFAGVVLVAGIVQFPGILVMAPIIAWVYGFADPLPATLFAVYALVVALSDNVLKPMLLARGVDVPMLVILVGAIGGAIAGGVIGLFVGAVLLAVGYRILTAWVALEAGQVEEPAP
ncbi:MAG TPA: AI-2E family transporter [Pseudomonadales bacterium]|nr:AI-2E family transporter [Pseudomonadales bacterium]